MATKKEFIEFWKRSIDREDKGPISNSEDVQGLLFSNGSNIGMNATIGQNYEDYQHSYENGYFSALMSVFEDARNDSDSSLMPIIFLSRHYLELSLKDEVLNLSIIFGTPMIIGNDLSHDLKGLATQFQHLLKQNGINFFSDDDVFWKIASIIGVLSPYSDEFRYTFNVHGRYNLPISYNDDENNHYVVNLEYLQRCMNYVHDYLQALQFITNDNEDSYLYDTPFWNPYIKGMLYLVLYSRTQKKAENILKSHSSSQVKNWIKEIIENSNLRINSDDVTIEWAPEEYIVKLCNENLFKIFSNQGTWSLKTSSIII